jgi:hypothetical protein
MIVDAVAKASSKPLKNELLVSPGAVADDPSHNRVLVSVSGGYIAALDTSTHSFTRLNDTPICNGSVATGLIAHRPIDRVIAVCGNAHWAFLTPGGDIVGSSNFNGTPVTNIAATSDDRTFVIGSASSGYNYLLATVHENNSLFGSIRFVSAYGTGPSTHGTLAIPVGTHRVVVQDAERQAGSLSLYDTESHTRLTTGLEEGPQPIASGVLERDGKLWGFADNRAAEIDALTLAITREVPTGAKPLGGKVASVDQTTNTVWVLLENSSVGWMTIP